MKTKEEISIQKKMYYQKNRTSILEKRKSYSVSHKTEVLARNRNYYVRNKHKRLSDARQYYLENKKVVIARVIAYEKRRMLIDTNYKLRKRLRARLKLALLGGYKHGMAIQLLGCSIDEFRQHLEIRFTDGMSWDNYGEWHIDHIIPCSSFDLTKVEEQKKCFHYTNQRPMWAKDNLRKGNRQCVVLREL